MDYRKLTRQLDLHEGSKLFPYVDTVGKITIGRGHNLTDKGVSKTVLEMMFQEDVEDAMVTLSRLFPTWTKLDDVRQRVFVDLAFNLGNRLAQFKNTLAAARVGNWNAASDFLMQSLWYRQVGQRGPRLVNMLRTGKDPAELMD